MVIKKIIIGLSVLISSCTPIDNAYLIVDSVVTDQNMKQPTWIALESKLGCFHVDARKKLVKIIPGRYRLAHIDFQDSVHKGDGTVFPGKISREYIKIHKNTINYLGSIRLKPKGKGGRKYGYEVDFSRNLLEVSCNVNPDIFISLPVFFVFNDDGRKEYTIKCSKAEEKTGVR